MKVPAVGDKVQSPIDCVKYVLEKSKWKMKDSTRSFTGRSTRRSSAERLADINIPTKSVTIEDGVFIGENSVVGAGSVVVKSIPANEIWAGNPAKFIKKL
ncbi:MAG: hypothetical protein KAG97_03700 [Victivallales bacterium]|nr:hypothetical protein [Victivallales bacterium]